MRRRRRRPGFCWRRRTLRLTLGRRRRLRPRCGLVWFRLRTIRFGTVRWRLRGRRTIRFRWRRWTVWLGRWRTVRFCWRRWTARLGPVRLRRWRAVNRRRWLGRTIRLRTICLSRVDRLIWTVILRLRGWRAITIFRRRRGAIRLRAIVCRRIVFRTIDFRAIAWLRSWHWATWLGRGWTIRLCRRGRTLIRRWLTGSRLIGRTIRRLVSGWRSGLSRASGIRLVARTAYGRRGGFAGRRLLHHRVRGLGGCGTQVLHFLFRQRLSGMRGQSLLLFGKRHGRGRRRLLRDHLPVDYRGGRCGYVTRARSLRSEYALACRSDSYPRVYGRTTKLLLVYRNRCTGDGLRAGEGTLRNHHYRTLNISVRIRHVGDGRALIDNGGVVDVGDHGGIDRGVADVDPVHVATTDLVGGHIDFARTEREPAHIAAEATRATADEDNQRGRIYGAHSYGSGDPSPASADRYPASVVEGCVAPGRVIDPGISPGSNPIPVACVIGRPANFNPVGEPDVTIVRVIAPVAIVIQVLVANNVVGQISRRARIVVAVIATVSPVIKLIGASDDLRRRRSANPSR